MRKIILPLIAIVLLTSCLPGGSSDKGKEKNDKKDVIGEIAINKAEIEKYYFHVNEKKINKAEVPYGAEVVLYIEGLDGFKEEKGKFLFDAGIYIYNSKNEEIAKLEDLYKENYPNGVPIELAKSKISLSVQCRPPMEMNEKYKMVFRAKDKKSEAKIEVTETFLMTASAGLTYKENGLTSSGVYFFRNNLDNGVIVDQKVSAGDTVYAYIPGVTGAFEKDGKVFPDASIILSNEFGDVLVEFKDMYGEYTKSGFNAEEFKALNVFHITTPTNLQVGKKYSLLFKLGDKKAKEKSLEAKYELIIK